MQTDELQCMYKLASYYIEVNLIFVEFKCMSKYIGLVFIKLIFQIEHTIFVFDI